MAMQIQAYKCWIAVLVAAAPPPLLTSDVGLPEMIGTAQVMAGQWTGLAVRSRSLEGAGVGRSNC
jgi:hypothetical protein